MRIAVVDIGTNSTRLLIADVGEGSGAIAELERRSVVTRLGDGVDANGSLSEAAVERVLTTVGDYAETMKRLGCEANLAVLTSAVRDAANGEDFSDSVRALGLDARVLSGDEEAQLMFLGAMSGRSETSETTVVIDIGGGSTEFVLGSGHRTSFHVSIQAGVVRMSERHIDNDPPTQAELEELANDVRESFSAGLSKEVEGLVVSGIAVAGTATSAAAIDQALAPYDPGKVHGYPLKLTTVESLLERLAAMDEAERHKVAGLHPDRAPTIVAGMVLLGEALRAVGLQEVEVSEHDILHGGALRLAGMG
ncbi:MAG TPA: Ppx/GppA phosphatase family protein [Solirubrobacteraceae bacterium]